MYKNMQITEKELKLNSLINESLASVMELSENQRLVPGTLYTYVTRGLFVDSSLPRRLMNN